MMFMLGKVSTAPVCKKLGHYSLMDVGFICFLLFFDHYKKVSIFTFYLKQRRDVVVFGAELFLRHVQVVFILEDGHRRHVEHVLKHIRKTR